MTTDAVRSRWAAGEAAYAAWLLLESPAVAGIAAAADVDAVVVDLQHGHATLRDLPSLLAAIERTPTVPFVRASWSDPAELMRALDLGTRGVICPMVGSRAEAEAFVGACRYPPAGMRSYGPIRETFGQGRDHTSAADATILLFAMIETAEGLANVDEIAATPGLDGLFAGPADLSLAVELDAFADLTDSTMLETLDTIVEAATRHGVTPGIHAPSPPRAAEMAARGFGFISCAVDTDLLQDAAIRALRDTRSGG